MISRIAVTSLSVVAFSGFAASGLSKNCTPTAQPQHTALKAVKEFFTTLLRL
jgi:hypothetical protein